MSQYQWTYPKDEPPLTTEEDNQEDEDNGEVLEGMWLRQMPSHPISKDPASNVGNKATLPENASHEPR